MHDDAASLLTSSSYACVVVGDCWDLWNCFGIGIFFDMWINMLMSLKQLWNNSKTIPKRFGIVSVFCFTCKSVWNKILFWMCFGFVLRCFVSVVRAALQKDCLPRTPLMVIRRFCSQSRSQSALANVYGAKWVFSYVLTSSGLHSFTTSLKMTKAMCSVPKWIFLSVQRPAQRDCSSVDLQHVSIVLGLTTFVTETTTAATTATRLCVVGV